MFPGETIATGAAATCADCGETPQLQVYISPGGAGFYIGTYCECGPYSRESEYFKTHAEAEAVLAKLNPDPAKNKPADHPLLRQP
jgi:hypothetical protein